MRFSSIWSRPGRALWQTAYVASMWGCGWRGEVWLSCVCVGRGKRCRPLNAQNPTPTLWSRRARGDDGRDVREGHGQGLVVVPGAGGPDPGRADRVITRVEDLYDDSGLPR